MPIILVAINALAALFPDYPILLETVGALAAFILPNQIVIYAHEDSLACGLLASSIILGIAV